ncbi:MAG: molybdopterin-binding protein [Sulfitobacter sp.]
MKFGLVPLHDAEGAILAHSVALSGQKMRKGRVLSQSDVAAMYADGLAQVIVARLDPGDVEENSAAARLAQALLAGSVGLRATQAFTGRVNLLATGPGVVQLDVRALEALNTVDPMITLATVQPYQQMTTGGMIATIKIISYAVSDTTLTDACSKAKGAISLLPPVLPRATLIVTEIPGGAGEKGKAAIEGRLTALGVALEETVIVPHDAAALTRAIGQTRSPLVLILTGSATSDIADVGPRAVVAAGGRIERFGMPVDPGNLLFLADLDGRKIIGLPGCARSPALNGADWVLSRVVCGIPVTGRDIAAMGVGGLLKEIPSRPQPRRG